MKIGIIVASNDSETVWNAVRFGNFALDKSDKVEIFLIGKGVEAETIDQEKFNVTVQLESFIKKGGTICACGTCLKIRNSSGSDLCPLSTMADLYTMIDSSDKIISF